MSSLGKFEDGSSVCMHAGFVFLMSIALLKDTDVLPLSAYFYSAI